MYFKTIYVSANNLNFIFKELAVRNVPFPVKLAKDQQNAFLAKIDFIFKISCAKPAFFLVKLARDRLEIASLAQSYIIFKETSA